MEVTDDSTLKINNSAVFESDIFYPTPKYGDEVAYPGSVGRNSVILFSVITETGRKGQPLFRSSQSE